MFSKEPQETKNKLQEPILPISNPNPIKKVDTEVKQSEIDVNKSELVVVVEKISGILSPYFIVLVGLYLYDNDSWFSFLLGSVLIITGVVSILKISGQDVDKFFAWLKKTLGYDSEENQ